MAYQCVSSSAVLKGGVRKETAWRLISDFAQYPAMSSAVEKVIVHERNAHEGRSEWFVSLEDAPLRWMAKDYFDADNYGIRFESIEGDFEKISGEWKVEDFKGEGIELGYSLNYHLGIPVIEEVVGAVLKEKMKNTIDSMMESIARQLHQSSRIEERVNQRIQIPVYNNIHLNGKTLRVKIINISRGGMMFECNLAADISEAEMAMDDVIVTTDVLLKGSAGTSARAVFKKEITQDDVDHLVTYFTTKNQRSHARKVIGKNSVLKAKDKCILAHIVDISPTGMLIECFDSVDEIGSGFEIGGIAIAPRKKIFDADEKTLRVQFAHTLDEADFSGLAAKLDNTHARPVEVQMA